MKEIAIKCLIIIICLFLAAIALWVRSFVVYKKDPTKKTKSIVLKVVALTLLIGCLCVVGYLYHETIGGERSYRNFVDKTIEEYREQNATGGSGLYVCPKCGELARPGRHSCAK